MSKKSTGRRNKKNSDNQSMIPKYYSRDEMIEMQAEAYCRALEMAEDRKKKKYDEVKERAKNIKFEEKIKFVFWMIFLPNKAKEKAGLREDITNGLFTLISSIVVAGSGHVIRFFASVFFIGSIILAATNSILLRDFIIILPITIFSFIFGAIMILSGQEIAQERDPAKITVYSAGVFALISMIISMISLLK